MRSAAKMPKRDGPFFSQAIVQWQYVEQPDRYPFSLPAVKKLDTLRFHAGVTYLIGENGSGKSTLIEGLAVRAGFNAEGGTKHFNFETQSSHSALCDVLTLTRSQRREMDGFFLRAESFYNVASAVDEYNKEDGRLLASYGGQSLHKVSHGESFMALVENRFREDSLFFLDEPEAALSPLRQLKLLHEIDRLVKQGCQFVIATHSPIVMSYPNSRMYELTADGPVETTWKETEHYQVTLSFLQRPDIFFKQLLDES